MAGVSDFIPKKKIKGKNSPPWINGEIIDAIKKKEAARRRLKKSPSNLHREKFKELRAHVISKCSCYEQMIKKAERI